MKKIFLIFIAACLASCGGGKVQEKNDPKEAKTQKNIKSVMEVEFYGTEKLEEENIGEIKKCVKYTTYNYAGKPTEIIDYDSYCECGGRVVFKYDDRGNCIEKSNYDINCSLSSKNVYKYDYMDRCIKEVEYYPSGELKYKATHKYQDYGKGNKTESIYYKTQNGWSIEGRRIYKYDEKDNMLQEIEYNYKDDIVCRIIHKYQYDQMGNKIQKGIYQYKVNSDEKMTYKCLYDHRGNKTREIKYGDKGEEKEVYEYLYDNMGNCIEKNTLKRHKCMREETKQRYDTKGNLLEETRNKYNCVIFEKSYEERMYIFYYYGKDVSKYDEKGNEIERILYRVVGGYNENDEYYEYDENNEYIKSRWIFKYEFDNNGNWVRRKAYIDGKLEEIAIRGIEYYDF